MPASHPLFETLLRVMRDLRRGYDNRARQVGLTLSRARALATLARHEGLTQARLAERLGIEQPTLKRQVDALVADGFVARQPLPEDARMTALVLTDRGRDSEIVAFTDRLHRDLLEGIPPEDLATATRVLERIARNIEGMERP